jgi:DNA-binding beta-propeller fold protein YncE
MAQRVAVHAPELPADLEWLNTEHPLSLRALRGKVVLLDFWTSCCINCQHVLGDLERLEERFGRELCVIGVHAAKYPAERDPGRLRQAVLRLGVTHPVVNDPDHRVWREYAVHSWPTLVLVDPAGMIVATHTGEDAWAPLAAAIDRVVREFDGAGGLDRRPLALRPEQDVAPRPGALVFPARVLADAAGDRLFVADTNHNRIVILRLSDGALEDVAGSGDPGWRDGSFDGASLTQPQGMALGDGLLYVADTGNHLVRALDLRGRTVATVAGTGRQAHDLLGAGPGAEVPLNSPVDVALVGDLLFVALAGAHQIWRYDPRSGMISPHAGSGREARVDGPLLEAAFAQPAGLATDGTTLFVADSEASAIRAVSAGAGGRVETLAGGDLFAFGDHDGVGRAARLQHPLGLAYAGGALYLADAFNDKIKRLDLATRAVTTVAGRGGRGADDGAPGSFDEPGGVAAAGGRLYVADTNNHALRTVDLATGAVATLRPAGLAPPARPPRLAPALVELPAQAVAPGAVRLNVSLELLPGAHLTATAPSAVRVLPGDPDVLRLRDAGARAMAAERPELEVPLDAAAGAATLEVDYFVYYSHNGDGATEFREGRVRVPVRVDPAAPHHALCASWKVH